MNSRRGFLRKGAAGLSLSLSAGAALGIRNDQLKAESGPSPISRDYWNDFPHYVAAKVNDVRAKRKSQLATLNNADAIKQHSAFVTEKVWELIGGRLEKTALNPTITGTVERPAYRIEKLIFESQPKFYVPAHLYLPKAGKAPFPAVLAPLGHAPDGKNYRSYQTLFQNLARQGFAVFTWDPPGQGERFQYLNRHSGQSLYGPTGEHDQFGWPALLIGSTTTQFEVIDGIRAVDYLVSRSEIDSTKIGCCGHSGGGTQTMYLCALEPRITAAVVVEGHTENLAGANYQPPGAFADSEQNIIGGLKAGIDRGDLLGAFAPKPLLICYTVNDAGTTYSPHYIEGNQEIFDELKSLYKVFEAEGKVGLFSSTLPHDYDFFHRRATYEWFGKWLQDGKQGSDEADFDEASDSSLWCTSTGQVLTSLGGRTAYQLNWERLRFIQSTRASTPAKTQQLQSDLRELLAIPEPGSFKPGVTLSSKAQRDVLIERIEFESEPSIRVPGWFVKPAATNNQLPVALLIQDQGCDVLFDQFAFVEHLVRQGKAVCSIDLRTTGITTPNFPSSGPLFYRGEEPIAYPLVNLWNGTPIVGQQTTDLLACLRYLEHRPDVNPDRIALYTTGNSGLAGIFATALENRIRGLLLERSPLDLESIVAAERYKLPLSFFVFGLLKKFDLPEICSSIAPRPLLVANPVDSLGEAVTISDINVKYSIVQRAYTQSDQAGKLSFVVQPEPIDHLTSEWFQKMLQ